MKPKYYIFKMKMSFLNLFSIVLFLLAIGLFYLLYRDSSFMVIEKVYNPFIVLYLPYLFFHELLHSLSYVLHGANYHHITYGIHLEKGVFCCLCKENIKKKNILYSLLYPFFFIGIITLILGIIIDNPLLILLSLANISGCSGDLLMFYHLVRLKNYEFSEFDNPTAFGIYTTKDLSNYKMWGLEYLGTTRKLKRDDLTKFTISKPSIFILIIFYLLAIFTFFIK